jgi:lipoprotein signal peptidase
MKEWPRGQKFGPYGKLLTLFWVVAVGGRLLVVGFCRKKKTVLLFYCRSALILTETFSNIDSVFFTACTMTVTHENDIVSSNYGKYVSQQSSLICFIYFWMGVYQVGYHLGRKRFTFQHIFNVADMAISTGVNI